MIKRFVLPFATSGDKDVIPDATDANGNVSYNEGYGADYQLPDSDPNYKPVGRREMNGIFNDITGAISELQTQGVATWVQPAGLIPPYPVNALVRSSDAIWRNTVANNSAVPGAANSGWVDITAIATESAPGLIELATLAEAQALTDASRAITPLLLATLLSKKVWANNNSLRFPDVPGGLIIKWGSKAAGSGAGTGGDDVTFPSPFPNNIFMASVTLVGAFNVQELPSVHITQRTVSSIFVSKKLLRADSTTIGFSTAGWDYLAIGN